MDQPLLGVTFYASGINKPVREWSLKLEPKQRKEIGADIQAVQWRYCTALRKRRKKRPGRHWKPPANG
jgi:hypothetical protein